MSRWRSEVRLLAAALLAASVAHAMPADADPDHVGGSSRPVVSSTRSTGADGSPIHGDDRPTGGAGRPAAGSVRRVHGRRTGSAPEPPSPPAGPVTATVRFGFDRARLSHHAIRVLEDLAREMGRSHRARLTISGYADAIGTDRYNLGLSARRALRVAQELRSLLHLRRIPPIVPYGERHPVARNTRPGGRDDPAGRALNRRVRISIRAAGPMR